MNRCYGGPQEGDVLEPEGRLWDKPVGHIIYSVNPRDSCTQHAYSRANIIPGRV